jgi:hypothetical protein
MQQLTHLEAHGTITQGLPGHWNIQVILGQSTDTRDCVTGSQHKDEDQEWQWQAADGGVTERVGEWVVDERLEREPLQPDVQAPRLALGRSLSPLASEPHRITHRINAQNVSVPEARKRHAYSYCCSPVSDMSRSFPITALPESRPPLLLG